MLATLFWSGNFVVGQAAVASITPLDLGWLGIGLGLLGVLTRGDPQRVLSFSINTGELQMLGAIVVWGFYPIIARTLDVPPIAATGVQVATAVGTLAPFTLALDVGFPETAAERWSLAYIAAFLSLGAFLFSNLALKTTPPGTAGNHLNLMVVFTAVITVALGTPLTAVRIVGGPMVIGGVLLTNIKGMPNSRRRERAPDQSPLIRAQH